MELTTTIVRDCFGPFFIFVRINYRICHFRKNTELSSVVSKLIETFRSSTGISIDDKNLHFLYLLLLGHGIRSNQNDFSPEHDFTLESKHLIESVSSVLGTDFTTDKELLTVTIYHLIPMVSRLNLGMQITDPLKNEIFNHHALIAKAVKQGSADIESRYQISLSEDEISLLSLHFLVAVERHRQTNHVLVICHAGAEISQYVLLCLQNNLPPNNELTLISPSELSKTNLKPFDLVISTTTVVTKKIPTLYISVLPRNEEISSIYWRLVEINDKKIETSSRL